MLRGMNGLLNDIIYCQNVYTFVLTKTYEVKGLAKNPVLCK